MEKNKSRPVSGQEDPNRELLSLAFDCTEMVTKLTRGYELEQQGDHASAISTLDSVESRLNTWLDKLDELDAKGVDKEKISRELKEAREAIKIDL